MDHRIFRIPGLGALFRLAKAIPIAPQKDDAATYEAAFARAAQVLRGGDLLAIFPEGGIMKIIDRAKDDGVAAPVIPMALTNLRGMFSRVGLTWATPWRPSRYSPRCWRGSLNENGR